jgi:hypothetical protein
MDKSLLDTITTAYDFYTGEHPAKRIAPHRNWDIPQLAGYEQHPRYLEVAEAMKGRVPYSDTVSDVQLVRNVATPRALGNYQVSTKVIKVIPMKNPGVTKFTVGHELGHHFLNESGRTQREISADVIGAAVLDNRTDPEGVLRSMTGKGTDNAQKYIGDMIVKNKADSVIRPVKIGEKYFYPSVWK